jgi:hypothetical protein
MPNETSLADFEAELKKSLERNHKAFEGRFAKEIDALLGLSREEIDEITPDGTDLEAYDQLITVVKEASRLNLSQANLKAQIEKLGQVAVDIAKKAAPLAALFI